MKCPCCGREIQSNERMCSYCGQNNESYVEPVVHTPVVQPRNNEYYNPNRRSTTTNNTTYVYVQPTQTVDEPNCTFAVLSLIFGLLGGWLGLMFGIIGLTKYKHEGKRAMCIIGIIAWAFWLVLSIVLLSSY